MTKEFETVIFHLDMDAFFASIEQRDNPRCKGRPVIVGAQPGSRGVVSACSYEARKFGVHSAMPISQAHRKCPQAVFLPVDMKRYQEASRKLMTLLGQFSPQIEALSIDEAFLDMSGTRGLFGPPHQAARAIKKKIKDDLQLPCSIGIASCRFIAKMASDFCKPDGLYQVSSGKEEEFIDQLALKDIWGLGKKTLERLNELGIFECRQLREIPEGLLKKVFGKAGGEFLYLACRGKDPGFFKERVIQRSISCERTMQQDSADYETIKLLLLQMAHQLMFQLIDKKERGRTVTLKIRDSRFQTVSIQKTTASFFCSAEELYQLSLELLKKKWDGRTELRLLGLGISSLEEQSEAMQGSLFEDDMEKKQKVEKAVLELKNRYGNLNLQKASLLNKQKKNQ